MNLEQQIKDLTQELLRLDREMMNLIDDMHCNQLTDTPEQVVSRANDLNACIASYFEKEQALEALMQQVRGASNV
jgi:hypothetical protein